MSLDDARKLLKNKIGNLCCDDVAKLLKSLGFEVRDGKRGGHKVYAHKGLLTFQSGSYNCGHGKNPEIKTPYIRNILKVLDEYESELSEWLKGKDND